MKCSVRIATAGSAISLALLLANCSSFDPTDIMDNLFAEQKKPLPGERKELFPGGTPGVSQGLPAELVKGYQPPAAADTTQAAQAPPDQAKPKPKPKPKVAAAPPAAPAGTPAASRSSPWPDPPPTRQSAAPVNAGQTVWPDPPAPGTVTR